MFFMLCNYSHSTFSLILFNNILCLMFCYGASGWTLLGPAIFKHKTLRFSIIFSK
jgi:hypothetical protein